jgi:D-alanyl-lipoteichoic acid acyltransferase DltB (MBOAT superfamily)
VIADNCAEIANQIFNNSADMNGSTLTVGAFFFSIQIYGDFSGYSDIAIGTSRLFGFDLKQNFATPYFSRNILEFWRRWHISLTSWLTDYVFTPLAIEYRNFGNRGIILSIFITFFISGLWHGANWTFIVWGLIHGLYYLLTILLIGHKVPKQIVAEKRIIPTMRELISMLLTFTLVSFSYIFFRAENLSHAMEFIEGIFSFSIFSIPKFQGKTLALITMFFITFFIIIEWLGRKKEHAFYNILNKLSVSRWVLYLLICLVIYFFGNYKSELEFIYFQF